MIQYEKINFRIKAIDRKTGQEIDGTLLFINQESDGGSASLQTTLNELANKYNIYIESYNVKDKIK